MPMSQPCADSAGNIALSEPKRMTMAPTFIQVIPFYNDAVHIEYNIYFMMILERSSAFNAVSMIIDISASILFALIFIIVQTILEYTLTLAIVKLCRTQN